MVLRRASHTLERANVPAAFIAPSIPRYIAEVSAANLNRMLHKCQRECVRANDSGKAQVLCRRNNERELTGLPRTYELFAASLTAESHCEWHEQQTEREVNM